jgi:thiamine-monophosphate kinase
MNPETTTVGDLGEDALIARLVAGWNPDGLVVTGTGDDCAVIRGSEDWLLLKTDALVEGVHFLPETEPERVGWKALCRGVSDIAAMAGWPGEALITIGLPAHRKVAWVEGVYRGVEKAAAAYEVALVGGETTASGPGNGVWISVALTGRVKPGAAILRSHGHPGDRILVTGFLGGSRHGKHLDFEPRLAEALWLAMHGPPTAMMDLSDGLAMDLPRLAKASGCGFRLHGSQVPCTPGCTLEQALGDGEDYELLLTLPPARVEPLRAAWAEAFPHLPLTVVGELTAPGSEEGLHGATGWEHFRSPEA